MNENEMFEELSYLSFKKFHWFANNFEFNYIKSLGFWRKKITQISLYGEHRKHLLSQSCVIVVTFFLLIFILSGSKKDWHLIHKCSNETFPVHWKCFFKYIAHMFVYISSVKHDLDAQPIAYFFSQFGVVVWN